MQASFLALMLVLAESGPVPKADAPDSHGVPSVSVPIPTGGPQVWADALRLVGGYRSGSGGGSWFGAEWGFADGSAVLLSMRGTCFPVDMIYCSPLYEAEIVRGSIFAGTVLGGLVELYWGDGIVIQFEISGPIPRIRTAACWYPCEGVTLSLGWNLLGGCWDCGWGLELEALH